jgi:fructoselysine-6-P-deglycase FrlB-like protein
MKSGIWTFVIGFIAGTAAALLFAPKSGEETRELIADTARKGADQGSRAIRSAAANAGCIVLPPYPAGQGPVQSSTFTLAASAIGLQQLAVALAHERGRNPDLIRREEEPYREAAKVAAKGFS